MENNERPDYTGKWSHNYCDKCGAEPGKSCVWTGKPNEKFPEPEGSPRAPHAGRKYYYKS